MKLKFPLENRNLFIVLLAFVPSLTFGTEVLVLDPGGEILLHNAVSTEINSLYYLLFFFYILVTPGFVVVKLLIEWIYPLARSKEVDTNIVLLCLFPFIAVRFLLAFISIHFATVSEVCSFGETSMLDKTIRGSVAFAYPVSVIVMYTLIQTVNKIMGDRTKMTLFISIVIWCGSWLFVEAQIAFIRASVGDSPYRSYNLLGYTNVLQFDTACSPGYDESHQR